jgi:hypothetical protein
MWLDVFERSDKLIEFGFIRLEAFTAAAFVCQTTWWSSPECNNFWGLTLKFSLQLKFFVGYVCICLHINSKFCFLSFSLLFINSIVVSLQNAFWFLRGFVTPFFPTREN